MARRKQKRKKGPKAPGAPEEGFSDLERGFFESFSGVPSPVADMPLGSDEWKGELPAADDTDDDEDDEMAAASEQRVSMAPVDSASAGEVAAVESAMEVETPVPTGGGSEVSDEAQAHDPPPVPVNFTQETVPDVLTGHAEPSRREGAGRVTLGLEPASPLPGVEVGDGTPFAVSSVEEALEALSAEDAAVLPLPGDDEFDDEYEDDDDDLGGLEEEGDTGDYVIDGDDIEMESIAKAPPPLPEEELVDDADLPAVSPAIASLMEAERLAAASNSGSSLPWEDTPEEVAAELPDSQLVADASEPIASQTTIDVDDIARAGLMGAALWSHIPLRPAPSPFPKLPLRVVDGFRASAQQIRAEVDGLEAPADKAAWLLEAGRLLQLTDDAEGASEAWSTALRVKEDAAPVLAIRASAALAEGRTDDARAAFETLAMAAKVPATQTAALLEASLLAPGNLDDLLGLAPEHPIATRISQAHKAAAGEWASFAAGLSGAADEDPLAKALATLRAGGDAQAALTARLADDPHDYAALALLVRLNQAPGREGELAQLAQSRGEASEGVEAARWLQIAASATSRSGDAEGAVDLLLAAYGHAPEDRVLEWRLEAALAQAGRWAELAELLGSDTRSRPELEQAARHARRAAVLMAHTDDGEGALGALERALELHPAYSWASERRLELLQREGKGDSLVEALRRRAGAATDNAVKAVCLYEAAEVLERELGDDAAALDAYAEAFEATGDHAYLWAALRVAEGLGAWDRAAALAEQLPSLTTAAESGAEVAGALYEHRLGDDAAALRCYLTGAQGPSPSQLALTGAARLLRKAEKWPELVALLEGATVTGRVQAALLYDAARLRAEQMDDAAGAVATLKKLAELDTAFAPAQWALKRLGSGDLEASPRDGTGSWMDLWARADIEPAWAAMMDAEADDQNPGSAAWCARGFALSAVGDDAALLEHLSPLSNAWALWHRGHLQILRGQGELGLSSLAAAALQELDATVIAELLWQPGGGHEVLAHQGESNPRIWLPLARFGAAAGSPAVDAWLARAAEVDEDRIPAALMSLARASGGGQPSPQGCQAVAGHLSGGAALSWSWWASRLSAAQGDLSTALDLLPQAADGLDGTLRGDRLLYLKSRPEALVEHLAQAFTPAADAWGRAAGMELATWQEMLGDLDGAAQTLLMAIEKDTSFNPARVALARVHARAEKWADVATVLSEHATHTTSEMLRAELKERWEEIRATRLEDSEALESRLRRRVAAGEEGAFDALVALLSEQGRKGDLAEVYRSGVALCEGPDERADLRLRLATLLEEEGDVDGAHDVYQDVLDDREGDAVAITALSRIARSRDDYNGLVAILAREAMGADEARRLELYREIAGLWEEHLGELDTALGSWRKVESLAPEALDVQEAVARLCRKMGRWDEFVVAAGRLLKDRPEDVGLAREIGEVMALKLSRPAEAEPLLQQAAAAGAFSREGFMAVADDLRSRSAWAELAALLVRIARQAQEVQDDDVAAATWAEVETLAHERLMDTQMVVEAREALADLKPDDPWAHHRLADSYHQAGMATRTLETIDKLLSFDDYMAGLEKGERLEIHRRRGRYLLQAERIEEALPELEAIYALEPTDEEAEGELLNLYAKLERWKDSADHLVKVLERRDSEVSDADRVRMLLELGRSRRKASQLDEAVAAFEQVAGLSANEVGAYLGLIAIRREQNEWNKLLGLYNQVIRCSTDPAQVVQAYVDKADILDVRLGVSDDSYVEKAAMHFEKALQFDRRNTYCMLRLSEIALRERAFARAGSWLQTLFGSGPSMSYQARAHVLGGVLAAEFQKDGTTALKHFQRAASVAQIPEALIAQLGVEIQRSPGNLDALLGLYAQVVAAITPAEGGAPQA